jgi:predicted AlkP superfamily phosphohydrolase/phosphomutase
MTPRNMRDQFDSFDWSKTVAYARTASANGIYICDDTHPGHEGLSEAEYRRLRDEIREKLLAWEDPGTGTPVVVKAVDRETAFPGPAMNEAPDLTLTLRDGGFISITKQDEILRPRPEVKGTHRPEGIFFAGGPGIRRGVELADLSVLDVTPTLLYSVGLPVPADLEGAVAEQVFEPEVLRRSPVRMGPPTESARHTRARDGDAVSGADENAVLQRLKALGYLS